MEVNLVPLIEAATKLTWQGALVTIAFLVTVCLMSWLRLIHGDRERAFWRQATPDQIMARAATTATLPPPTKAPVSPIGPALVLLIIAAGLMWQPIVASIRLRMPPREAADIALDYNQDLRARALPVYRLAAQ